MINIEWCKQIEYCHTVICFEINGGTLTVFWVNRSGRDSWQIRWAHMVSLIELNKYNFISSRENLLAITAVKSIYNSLFVNEENELYSNTLQLRCVSTWLGSIRFQWTSIIIIDSVPISLEIRLSGNDIDSHRIGIPVSRSRTSTQYDTRRQQNNVNYVVSDTRLLRDQLTNRVFVIPPHTSVAFCSWFWLTWSHVINDSVLASLYSSVPLSQTFFFFVNLW